MMEEVDTITVAVSGIDINKVEPLDTRRLVTFINHYLATTVSFLNHFATQCESKLDRMQQQLHRVECRLKLLECKLASIPGIPTTTGDSSSSQPSSSGPTNVAPTAPGPSAVVSAANLSSTSSAADKVTGSSPSTSEGNPEESHREVEDDSGAATGSNSNSSSVKEDPRYAKYFKMITVGVPVPAVKQKMISEGVDPAILDM